MTATTLSRPGPEIPADVPYSKLYERSNIEAQQAEVLLLRKLLTRACNVLQDVAIEARLSGETDAMTEALMRDIMITLNKLPTLV